MSFDESQLPVLLRVKFVFVLCALGSSCAYSKLPLRYFVAEMRVATHEIIIAFRVSEMLLLFTAIVGSKTGNFLCKKYPDGNFLLFNYSNHI